MLIYYMSLSLFGYYLEQELADVYVYNFIKIQVI